ncbi:energy transducer TonB [Kaistella palustris]|uniref:energy transducer TonB n=1 Tax=Kaistella palustris TaxID=493376 RepID=UPI0003FF1562|nr:energy transducer TonB [Kaistella palustris]
MRYFYLFLICSSLLSAQKPAFFPRDQYSYLGGEEGFYKDFQKVLLNKKLQPCENAQELVVANVVINENGSASHFFSDNTSGDKNRCAALLADQVLPEMTGWIPAHIAGKAVTAKTSYIIFPHAFFSNFKEGYSADKFIEPAKFKTGIRDFRREVMKRADPSGFFVKGSAPVVSRVRFVLNEDGEMQNIELEKSSGLQAYDDMILSSVRAVKTKWTPQKIHGIAVKWRFVLPFSLSAD